MTDLKQNPGFEIPDDDSTHLWRYMALDKFARLISSSSLYFASARQFEDSFEGAITQAEAKRRRELDERIGISRNNSTSKAFEELRRLTKINCWHLSQDESVAMWGMYLRGGKGVAIRSTGHRLLLAFKPFRLKPEYGEETIRIGRVRYVDYRAEDMTTLGMEDIFFYKRKSFSYEHEVRAMISLRMAEEFGVDVPEKGILVAVDLGVLLESVFVAPGQPSTVVQAVESALKNAGLVVKVNQSELDDTAIY